MVNKNIALLFASIFLFIFILEIFFTKVLNKLPLKFHGLINPRLFALVQSSKNSVMSRYSLYKVQEISIEA